MVHNRRDHRADLLQIYLHGKLVELLHILPDRQIRCHRVAITDIPVRICCIDGSRHIGWRSCGRPLWQKTRYMGINTRHCPVQPIDATCIITPDCNIKLLRRLHSVICISRHIVICTGTPSDQTWHDLRALLRIRIRSRRYSFSRAWRLCRHVWH